MPNKLSFLIHPETDFNSEQERLMSFLRDNNIPDSEMSQLTLEVEKLLVESINRAKELSSCGCQYDMVKQVKSESCVVEIHTSTKPKTESFLKKITKHFS